MEMGMGNVDEEADDIYNGILGEIGLDYEMSDPTRVKPAIVKKKQEEELAAKMKEEEALRAKEEAALQKQREEEARTRYTQKI